MLTSTAIATPAADFDLTLLATVKSELGIADRSEDEKLARWITQASGEVSRRLNRVFAKETLVDTFRLKWRECTDSLNLSRFPVIELLSVVENDVTLSASDYELSASTGILTRLRNDDPWRWTNAKVVVTYSAGYASLSDLPEGVERLAIIFVNQYRYAAERDPLLHSEATTGAGSSTYFDAGSSPEAQNLIADLRKPANG